MNYEIRAESFTGSPPLPPYNNGGHKGDIEGADFTHAIYDGDRLIFRAVNRKHANTLLARLHTMAPPEPFTVDQIDAAFGLRR